MGIVKRQWLEQEERGWSDPETWVCRRCIGDDPHLRYLVGQNLGSNACTYCGSSRRKAAPLAALMTAVLHGLRYSYNDEANAGCPYDKEFNIEFMSSSDVLQQMLESEGLEWPEKLLDDAAEALANTGWVDAPDGDWMGAHTHERLHWSWGSFTSRLLKYCQRVRKITILRVLYPLPSPKKSLVARSGRSIFLAAGKQTSISAAC